MPSIRFFPAFHKQINGLPVAEIIELKGRVVEFPGSPWRLHQPFAPAGDQPEAIHLLTEGIEDGLSFQTLLGVTGSGKTYTMANVIARPARRNPKAACISSSSRTTNRRATSRRRSAN